ncbi:MAG: SIMPL domain-containing protein [Planctomyces sp.]|nr:SIMPL domain-containing protein [Planctomyces sp.]
MTDAAQQRSTVSTNASATVRLRPTILLMLVRVRATAATLELGLADIKQRSEETARRLTRLGATRVETGEPHADESADMNPVSRMRAAVMPRLPRPANAPLPDRAGVNVSLTAIWDIEGFSAEKVLVLVDQLRFDAAADPDAVPPTPPAAPSPWSDPEEHLRSIMAQVTEPPPADLSPQFLYISRPNSEQLANATTEAFGVAKQMAERLAHSAGRRLGEPSSIHYHGSQASHPPDRVLERQRCASLLAASSYKLQGEEVVSEDPRSVEVTVSVHVTHHLE